MARIRRDAQRAGNAAIHDDETWLLGIYLRLSREDGNDESHSVINQKKIINAFLAKEFDDRSTVVDYFVDDGITGTDDSRAEFMRLISYVEARKVNCIICKTLSRAFRNYADQGYYLESYFPQKKVRFISLSDPMIDTHKHPDALTSFEVPIFGVVNDRYAAMTSNAVRRTFKMKQEKGEFIGAFPPYGFLKDPTNKSRLVLDPETAPIKRDIKDWMIVEGLSLLGVAKRLNDLGIPNPTAYKKSLGWKYSNPNASANDGLWNASVIRRMLLSKNNIGHMVQGKQRIISYKVHEAETLPESKWKVAENVIEPTFTQEEYDSLVRLLKRDTRAANEKKNVCLLSGLIRCADCGKAMHRKASGKYVYYYCRTYKEKKRCTMHAISERELSDALLASIRIQIDLLSSLADAVKGVHASQAIPTQSERIAKLLNERKKELGKTQSLLEGLYVDLKGEVIDRTTYERLKKKLTAQAQQAAVTIGNLQEEQRKLETCPPPENDVFQTFLTYRNITGLDRAILNELVETVKIYEGKRIAICFRYADEVQRNMGLLRNKQG